MDAENEHFRFYTFMRLKLGDNGKKILQDLQAVFGAKCVGISEGNDQTAERGTATGVGYSSLDREHPTAMKDCCA
nr:hypothetical protein BaRGS_014291 [Batillaria attramentaria]